MTDNNNLKYNHKYGIVYKITNTINGQVYIGQTTRLLGVRKYEHEKRTGTMKSEIKEYGINNFKWEILCECLDIDSLNFCEDFIIKTHRSNRIKLYNKMDGGRNSTHSTKTKISISKSNSGENHPFFNKKHKDESKKLISINRKNYIGIDSPFYNKKHTNESKSKMRDKKLNTYIFYFEDGSEKVFDNISQKSYVVNMEYQRECLENFITRDYHIRV